MLVFKCGDCKKKKKKKKKNYEKQLEEDLAKRFENTCGFCDGDINKFCLMLWKGMSIQIVVQNLGENYRVYQGANHFFLYIYFKIPKTSHKL